MKPSAKTLLRLFDEHDPESMVKARKLRRSLENARCGWSPDHDAIDAALELASQLADGFGVESIRGNGWERYYCDIAALYVNRGDTYDTTLIYDVERGIFLVQSYGDWVELAERRGLQVY